MTNKNQRKFCTTFLLQLQCHKKVSEPFGISHIALLNYHQMWSDIFQNFAGASKVSALTKNTQTSIDFPIFYENMQTITEW